MDQKRPLVENDDNYFVYYTPGKQRRNIIIIALLAVYSVLDSVVLIVALLLILLPTEGDSLPPPPPPSLFVNVSASELMSVNVDPTNQLRLFEGGYIASLETYHHLHCIRRLKWHLYKSYYFANITKGARTLEMNHMNHCIESLRLATMCHADTSLYTLKWRDEGKRPEPINHGQRKCTIWNQIEEWAMPRAVSNSPKLVNPDKLKVSSARAEEAGMPSY